MIGWQGVVAWARRRLLGRPLAPRGQAGPLGALRGRSSPGCSSRAHLLSPSAALVRVRQSCTYSRYSTMSCASLKARVKLSSLSCRGSSASMSPCAIMPTTFSSVSRSVSRT
jgi:hypothetical protein